MRQLALVLAATTLFTNSCRTADKDSASKVKQSSSRPGRLQPLNLETGTKVLYEMQFRSANACDPTIGADWQKDNCIRKKAPKIAYRAKGMSCPDRPALERIRLGTIDDALEDTADYRAGITVRYIKEKVGANMIWLMPMFPNNDIENIPHECDNLGSPYAVRDYFHVAGTLSRSCIEKGRDEYSNEPCWANDDFDRFIKEAHQKGIKVMLDIAFNHFGHNYLMYDYADFRSINERIEAGEDLNKLWDLEATYEDKVLQPQLLDTEKELNSLAQRDMSHQKNLQELKARCPSLSGNRLVIAYNAWRNALKHERLAFSCEKDELENRAPGFFMGANKTEPSTGSGDFISSNWVDVKFLYHRESNALKQHEFIRNREYLFRVMNYWVSRGVDGFRLDHATDGDSGLSPNFWHYIISKVNHYAAKRGQERPIYMAEEFYDQLGMDRVVDMMTEGYVFDINNRGGGNKNTPHIENVLRGMERFPNQTYTVTGLETHDEHRLVDATGFNLWTGAGFWGIGATTRSTPMILMGQEFGEVWGLGFKKSDFLRSRFEGSNNWVPDGDKLRSYYQKMILSRLSYENRALYSHNYHFLRTRSTNKPDDHIFAQVKWSDDLNVIFVFHNLWEQDSKQTYFIPPNIGNAIGMQDSIDYKFIDIISGEQQGPCRKGKDIKWELPVELDRSTRAQWLRMETC